VEENRTVYTYDDEIDFRKFLGSLNRYKYVIAAITILCMVVIGLLSFFVIQPSYRASTIIAISQMGGPQLTPTSNMEEVVSKLAEVPQLNTASYVRQVKVPAVLKQAVEKLNEMGYEEQELTISKLRQMVEAETIADTDLIEITATAHDPALAATVANAVREEFMHYMSELNNQKLSQSVELLDDQLKNEEKHLQEATESLKRFQMQTRSVDFLTQELEGTTEDLVKLESSRRSSEIALARYQSRIQRYEQSLEEVPRTIPRAVQVDGVLGSGSGVVDMEELNPVYTEISQSYHKDKAGLASCEAQINKTISAIAQLEVEIRDLQAELTEKQTEQNKLQNEVDMRQETVKLLNSKRSETQMARSVNLAHISMVTASPALVPEKPFKPKKMVNVAAAGMLGFVLAVFGVFFREYIKIGA
jgi:succinoglycan biosynthesis transport protein ExoP